MGLPPHSFGTRARSVRHVRIGEGQWRVVIDERPLARTFVSETEARDAAAAEVVRLDGLAFALLRRLRSGLNRKRP